MRQTAGSREREPEPGPVARVEDWLAAGVLGLMCILPLAELIGRDLLGRGVTGSIPATQYLTLIATFAGAALAARHDRHLALATTGFLPEPWGTRARLLSAFGTVGVTGCLVVAAVQLVMVDRQFQTIAVWGIPVWVVSLVMPLGFGAIALRAIRHASPHLSGRALAACALLVPLAAWLLPPGSASLLAWPVGIALLLATALGMPIFAALAGAALAMAWVDGTPISGVPGESYRLSTSPLLPAIPLFTLAGYLLSAGGSGQRLLRLFTTLVGWLPGGLAIVITLVLALFTPLTGASGVTILALGGLMLPMMVQAGYPERDGVGLVTVSGSIGVLLPPSLPVILYAFYAELPLEQLFRGGLIPGLLLIAGVAGYGAWSGWRSGAQRSAFDARELAAAAWSAKWELLLPVVVLGAVFGGWATLVEAAALTVAYALLLEAVLMRELSLTRDLPRLVRESATLVGGFMIILGVALAFTNYLILAQVPMQLLAWVQEVIRSPLLFLLALNAFLIVVGALMDIYSAIIVVVPLLAPMAAAYGIDPVHLGIVFLANMQLGYLMPPMGENLFLAAYRFDQPLGRIYRATLPYLAVLLAVVLLVTYWPALTLWPVEGLRR
jgi:tripartite ATP-independent transporter DctM subunit